MGWVVVSPESIAKQFRTACLAAFAALWVTVHAQQPADRASLTNFDKRVSSPQKAARPEQSAARAALKQRVPGAVVDFDPIFDTPKWVQAGGGLLTGENGEGRGVSKDAATRFEKDSNKALKAFLHEHRPLFRHGPEVLDDAVKKRDHSADDGLRTVAWEQQVDGIPVFDSVLVAHTTKNGELISVSSQFVPEPARAADRGTPNRAAKALAPGISAERALKIAAANVGEEISELTPLTAAAQKTFKQQFRLKPLPGDASVSLVWLPLDGDTLRLCWAAELTRRELGERFRFVIDAEIGEILVRRKLTVEVSEVSYRVYTSDSPSPFSPGFAVPTNAQPPYVQRSLLSVSNLNATASPLGWLHDGVLETRGNNVDAHLDRDNDDRADLPRVQGTITNGQRAFDFPIDLKQDPTNYSSAAVVQLFYWCNFMHDKLYELGFTEGAGNFQKDNFGRGGQGSDAVSAEAQDGSGFNNANYTPTFDGSPPKIQMYIFNGPTPARDGDFDAEVICHEYTHGLSDRLIGGGAGIFQLQSFGMGEGWSDFYAEALLSQFEDDLGGNYPMGGYVTYQFGGLTQNYYYGIRRYPYTTNLNVNPLTFKDIDPTIASTHPGIPRNPIVVSSGNQVHRQGEVWCSMLWDMRANLLRKYAPTNATEFTNVNMRILRYVTRGLQLSPPNPNFVQARDAILQAVSFTLGSGTDTNEVWRAFARRGLGLSAYSPDSSTTIGVVEAYDTPELPELDILPRDVSLAFSGTLGGPFTPGAFTNQIVSSSVSNIAWAVGGTPAWLNVSPTNGVLSPNVPVDIVFSLTSAATNLLAATYTADVYFTNLFRTQVVSRAVELVVEAPPGDPLLVTPISAAPFQGLPGGPFTPAQQVYRVSLNEAQTLGWQAFTTNTWLSISPTNGVLDESSEFTDVAVSLNASANALPEGNYSGAVTFINTGTRVSIDMPISLRLSRNDYFTEDFNTETNGRSFDLQNKTITFTRDGSSNFYFACISPAAVFPINPSNATPITLADDQYRQVTLTGGKEVSIYGISSNAIYIGANGNVTFDPGLNTNAFFSDPALNEYFAHVRAAPLFADINPAAGGTVSWMQLEDRFVVTWQDVPEFDFPENLNSAQLELWFNGVIRMTWLQVKINNPNNLTLNTGLSRGTGRPPDFVRSDLSSYNGCVPLALLLPPRGMETESVFGRVIWNAVLTNDLVLALSSSDTNEAVVPSAVVIPAGQASAEFEILLIDDFVADGTQPATITATLPDLSPISATLLVDDFPQTDALLSIGVPSRGREGDTLFAGGMVSTIGPVLRPLAVNLSSDDSSRVVVPPSVVIPTGKNSALFDIILRDNNLIEGTNTVGIEASVPNWAQSRIGSIRVSDNESRALTLVLPGEAIEGQGPLPGPGRVSLSGIPITNVVIALQSENTNLVSVPRFLTNAAGQTSVTFPVVVGDNAITNGFESVRVFASAPGFSTATGAVVIIDDERPFEPSNPSPEHLATHVRRNVTLSWSVNSHAPPTTVYDVYLGTTPDLSIYSPIASTTSHSTTLPLQLDAEKTYYWQVVARLQPFPPVSSPVWQFTTATVGFQIDAIASPQFVNEPFPVTVTARDEFGLAVTNYQGSVTLTNSASMKSSSTIVITEVETAGIRAVEFVNVSDRSINIGGWQIVFYDALGWPAPSAVFTVPSPSVSAAGDVFIIRNLPAQFFPGTYPSFTVVTNLMWNNNADGNPVAVLLRDNVGNIVDFVCASGAEAALISNPVAIPATHWNGAPLTANLDSARTYQRFGARDFNTSGDWHTLPRSVRTNNVGLLTPFTSTTLLAFTATPLDTFVNGTAAGFITLLEQGSSVRLGATDAQGRGAISDPFDVFWRDDISLAVSAPHAGLVNGTLAYQFTIANTGPLPALGVRFVNSASSNSLITSANASQGACVVSNGVVDCALGTVRNNLPVTVSVLAEALSRGVVSNFAAITRADPDADPANNSTTASTIIAYPQLTIFDATNAEPFAAGTILFTVRLTEPNTQTSSVAFATSDGTATGGVDYQPLSGVLVFPPGTTNQTITVSLNSDSRPESNETFFVNLFNGTNLDVTKAVGVGTIVDNDSPPLVSVADVTVAEGEAGSTAATFSVSLNAPSGRIVSVGYSTANGTGLAGLDYVQVYGALVFAPGVTNLAVTVPVIGDTIAEPAKQFFLNLANPLNSVVVRGQGTATILDSDVEALDHFTVGGLPPVSHMGDWLPFNVTARDSSGAIASSFNGPARLLALTSPRTVTVASNNTPWPFPLGASFHDARVQSIYSANELGGAGRIFGLALDIETAPGQMLSNFTIRLRHTPNERYFVNAWESSGWTTNYRRDVSIVTTGWTHFAFSEPFDYNGRDHVMVDFSFDNVSFSSDGLCRSTTTAALRSLHFRTDGAYGKPIDWIANAPPGALTTRVPNVQLFLGANVPTVLGQNGFAGGVWTGSTRLLAGGSNVVLRAIDAAGHFGDSAPFTIIPVRIASVTRVGAAASLSFATLPGRDYQVQASTNVQTGWSKVSSPITGDGNVMQFTLPAAGAYQFYRLRLLEE